MQIFPLSEGAFTVDKSKKFIPFDTAADDLQHRSKGSLLVEVQPFAVVTTRDVLLFDTGLGFTREGQLQLYNNLRGAGIAPARVTKVLLSHLHKDHAGGICHQTPDGGQELSFPQARYYIQKKELEFAFQKGFPSYVTEDFDPLRDASNLELLDGNGLLDGYIRYELTGAHSPYHQVFWVQEGKEKIFFGGDVSPQLQQMKNRLIAKYDDDGKKSMEFRRLWWHQGEQEKWIFLFYHDIKTPVWRW